MGTLVSRSILAIVALLTALVAAAPGAGTAQAMPLPEVTAVPSTVTVDGFAVTHLPPRLGANISDFAYEYDGVAFASKVWESGSADAGYNVDLDVHVLRSDERLPTTSALRSYLTEYLERDAATWRLRRVDVSGHVGYLGREDVFWLVGDGVAVWISTDPDRVDQAELLATARGVRPA